MGSTGQSSGIAGMKSSHHDTHSMTSRASKQSSVCGSKVASSAKSVGRHNFSKTSNAADLDPELKLIIGDVKNIGMSDDEWNRIVLKNLSAHKEAEEGKRAKLAKEREALREELNYQVENKKSMAVADKNREYEQYVKSLAEVEKKR